MTAGRSPALTGPRVRSPSREKRPPPPSTASAPSPALEPPPLLPGAEVEVRVDGPGFHGSWFEATVVRFVPARGRSSAARYTVAYSHLGADGALAEPVAASHIRPRPPQLPSSSSPRFGIHDVVEAFHRGGWWSGVVFPSPSSPAAAKSVTVAFPFTREVITVPPHYVRPRRDYVGGEWVPSRAAIAVQPARELRVYEVGDKVEAVRDREPYGKSWFPATVAKAVDWLSYIVEYSDEEEEEEKATEYLHWQYIRPAVDRFWPWEDKYQISLGAEVEMYCDGAWSLGVVRRVIGEGEYEISVNGKEAEHVVTKVAELLRPRHEWDGSHWNISSPEKQANLRQHSASGNRPSSPVEVTSSDDEHSDDPEYSGIKKAKREPLELETVLAEGSEQGYSTPPNKLTPVVGENPVNEDTLPNRVLPGNTRGRINAIEEFKGNNDSPDNTGFKEPCSQHSPLDGTVAQQEGTALGLMLPFHSLVESIMKSCTADSEASFEKRNSILSKLKANVEYMQSCQNRLADVKSEYTKLVEEKGAVEAQKLKKRTSLSQLNSLLEENDKAIAELEQKLEHLRQKGWKIEKEREHEESELEKLEGVSRTTEEACDAVERLYCSILVELQLKLLN